MIPGPDTQLASYYTYLDKDDNPLFHFTSGDSPLPKTTAGLLPRHALGSRSRESRDAVFLGNGAKGFGNVEFKKICAITNGKLIRCNPRITAAHELLVQCGMETDWVIYCHLTDCRCPKLKKFEENVTLWFPRRDWLAIKN